MRLTKQLRDAFIKGVMADVPKTDYREIMQARATELAVARLPEKIRAIWNDPALRDYVATDQVYVGHRYINVPGVISERCPPEWASEFTELEDKSDAQEERLSELREKIRAVVYSVTTTEALLKQLPEFAKYVPKSATTDRTVPAVANLVSELTKAGWPKGRE